jgi:hypothetical protein
MPRQSINLDPYKADIIQFISHDQWTQGAVLQWLETIHNLKISPRTLRNYLQTWGIRTQTKTISQSLIDAVDLEFHTTLHTDEKSAEILNARGLSTTAR